MNKSYPSISKTTLKTILLTITLHYLITPFEGDNSTLVVYLTRIGMGLLFLATLGFRYSNTQTTILITYFATITIAIFTISNALKISIELAILISFTCISLITTTLSNNQKNINQISRTIDWLIIGWISSLTLQIAWHLSTTELLDVHNFFFPTSEARLESIINIVRYTGVHIEPGTYANWMFGLIILRSLAKRQLFDRLALAGVLSTLATMSAWAFLGSATYLITYLLHHVANVKIRSLSRVASLMVTCILLSTYLSANYADHVNEVISYFTARSELEDASGSAKVSATEGFKSSIPEIIFTGKPLTHDFCGGCLSPQDSGIFINIAIRTGLIYALIIFLLISAALVKTSGWPSLLLMAPLCFAKYYYFDPIFWMIVGFSIYNLPFRFKSRNAHKVDSNHELANH